MTQLRFKLASELTFNTVSTEQNRLFKSMQNVSMTSLCLDLSEVALCDSAGLALLIEAKRLCRQFNKNINIENMSKEIDALTEFCGVQEILSSVLK